MKTRARLVDTAAEMLCRRGLNATSIRELAKEANAPLGSTYHYFPGGKSQVVIEAVQYAGQKIGEQLQTALEQGPKKGIEEFIQRWREIMVRSNFHAGCTVLAASIEEPTNKETEVAIETAGDTYNYWGRLLLESFIEHNIPSNKAEELAATIIAATEGAIVLCRAKRTIEPLDQVANQLYTLLDLYL
jgi:AcrR family transcriptional regulator